MSNNPDTAKPFTLPEYTASCACPRCGGEMTPTEYYAAKIGAVSRSTDLSNAGVGKITTTTTAQYHDIRRKTGALCVSCFNRSRQFDLKLYSILSIAFGVLGLLCFVEFILFLAVPAVQETIPIGWFGIFAGVITLIIAYKSRVSYNEVKAHLELLNSGNANAISSAFVVEKPVKLFRDEVLLSRGDVERMKPSNPFKPF